MGNDIKELFGGNAVIVRCTIAEEIRTVAELAIEALGAQNISDTVGEVLRHNDLFYETSAYKWVKLNNSALSPGGVVMSALIPVPDERIPKSYITISPDDFCIAISKQEKFYISDREFSDLFQELVS